MHGNNVHNESNANSINYKNLPPLATHKKYLYAMTGPRTSVDLDQVRLFQRIYRHNWTGEVQRIRRTSVARTDCHKAKLSPHRERCVYYSGFRPVLHRHMTANFSKCILTSKTPVLEAWVPLESRPVGSLYITTGLDPFLHTFTMENGSKRGVKDSQSTSVTAI